MANYYQKEIEKVLKEKDEFFRIKITSENNETKWMNISPIKLKRLQKIMD